MEERLPTNTPLDKILNGGLEKDVITNIYGPAGSGKSNIALSAAISCGGRVIYVDTEGSFSMERFRQLGGEKHLSRVIVMEVHTWEEQHKAILKAEKLAEKDIGLIVVDSLVNLYRLELDKDNFQQINRQLASQYSVLSRIARKFRIPVLVTNQVYSKGEEIELTSRMIARYWSKTLVELKRLDKDNCRLAILRKHRSMPEGKKIEFEITEKGLKQVGIFSL